MPKNAKTDPDSGLRFYSWKGRALLSVTTLRRLLGMPFGLHNWVVNQSIGAAIDELGNNPKYIEADLSDEVTRKETAKVIRSKSMAKRDDSADLGTRVHAAADAHTTIADADADVRPFLRQFYNAKDALNMRIVASEVQVFNLTMGYAGSLDLMAYVTPDPQQDEWLAIIDLKTGSGLYIDHLLQLFAYSHAEFIGKDDTIDTVATDHLHKVQGIAVLHLTPESWEFVELAVKPDAVNAFADMTRLANWMHDNPDLKSHTVNVVTGAAPKGA